MKTITYPIRNTTRNAIITIDDQGEITWGEVLLPSHDGEVIDQLQDKNFLGVEISDGWGTANKAISGYRSIKVLYDSPQEAQAELSREVIKIITNRVSRDETPFFLKNWAC
jgi:hypothetical protein